MVDGLGMAPAARLAGTAEVPLDGRGKQGGNLSWDRAGRIARKLARPEVWARLGKIGTVRAQNWLRRGALWWIFPEYRAIPPEQPR